MASDEQQTVTRMFDRIAPRYDLTNRVLSMGQDIRWRNFVARLLPKTPGIQVLDLATGTGDLVISMVEQRSNIAAAMGVDLSQEMLKFGQEKLKKKKLVDKIKLIKGDAKKLHLEDSFFDVVTVGFGIRNMIPKAPALQEIRRVLKPQGKVIILEFSLPKNFIIRQCYLKYFRYGLPIIGGILSGDFSAYRYLNQTVESFPYAKNFAAILEQNGFKGVLFQPLSFGIATVYQAQVA